MTAGAILALPRYLLFALVALVGPGLAVQRLARTAVEAALVLPAGLALCAGAQWLALVTGQAWLCPALLAALDLCLLLPLGPWRRAPGPSLRGALAPSLAVVAVLALSVYPSNRVARTGEFLLDPLVAYDTAFHVGLARELTIGYPPQVPGVSGRTLGYHLGPDLVRAAALRWAAVDPYDSISRYDVTLGALALVLLLRAVTARVGGPPRAVALVPWTLLAGDLAWVLRPDPGTTWWVDLLRGNLLVSLVLSNPVVPALALALACLVALGHALEHGTHPVGSRREGAPSGHVAWSVLAVGLAFAVPFFKVFLGAHLVLGLGAAWAIRAWRTRREGRGDGGRLVLLACTAAAATTTLLLVCGRGGATVEAAWAPLDLVRITRETLGDPPLAGTALAAYGLIWLVASLGVRVVGIAPAARALVSNEPVAAALATIALTAWPLGLLFRVSAPEMLAGQRVVNDAAYLVEQGGPVLWIFSAIALATAAARVRPGWLVLATAAALAAPAPAQFIARKLASPPDPLPAPMVRAMAALASRSAPGEVVMQRPMARFPPPPVILIGRRVPYERFTPWLTQFVPAADLEQRHESVYRFFRTPDAAEARAIAEGLGARHLCLYGADRVRFPTAGLLQPVHEEPAARCYGLAWPQAAR